MDFHYWFSGQITSNLATLSCFILIDNLLSRFTNSNRYRHPSLDSKLTGCCILSCHSSCDRTSTYHLFALVVVSYPYLIIPAIRYSKYSKYFEFHQLFHPLSFSSRTSLGNLTLVFKVILKYYIFITNNIYWSEKDKDKLI